MITRIIEKKSAYKPHKRGYYLKVTLESLKSKNYIESREYESEADALIAQGVIETIYQKTGEVEVSEYEFLVKSCLRLIDSPNKW